MPVDFLVSSDGTKAYIPIQGSASILVFDIAGGSISSIALSAIRAQFPQA